MKQAVDANGGTPAVAAADEVVAEVDVGMTDAGLIATMERDLIGAADATPAEAETAAAPGAEPEAEAEAAEPEAEAEAEKPDADADNVLEFNGKRLPPELQAKVDARIGKEVGKRKELEDRLTATTTEVEALRARLAEAEAQPAATTTAPDSLDKLLATESETEIAKREDWLREAEAWCVKHWDGYEGKDAAGNPVEYDKGSIRERYMALRDERERALPAARTILAQRRASDAAARAVYPALFDKTSDEARLVEATLKAIPGLRRLPQARMIIGDMLAGEKLRQAAAKKAKEPARVTPAPAMPRRSASASDLARQAAPGVKGRVAGLAMRVADMSDAEALSAMDALSE